MMPADLITPLNPWSLWVPLALLAMIVLAAVFFLYVSLR